MPIRTSLLFFLATAALSAIQPIIAATAATVTSTSWVYYNGTFDWPTDYSFSASPDYFDTSGEPRSGAHDIRVQVTSAWGGWAPVAKNYAFNDTAYNNLTVSLKPTVANQKWQIYFVAANGQSLGAGCGRNPASYGPSPAVGKWATYTIPLSDLCVSGNASVYKFVVQDATGLSDNSWYVDNVGFEAVGTVTTGTPAPTPTAAATPAAASTVAGTSWVYYNGALVWPGDYSFSVNVNYKDTSGHPLSGAYDTKISLFGPWGGWQPYGPNKDFNTRGYTKLTFALKPTQENQQWNLYFVGVGDRSLGSNCAVNVLNYGPAPVVGKWAVYTVPLSNLCVSNTSAYKFAIHDETGSSYNVWYVDNVGFMP